MPPQATTSGQQNPDQGGVIAIILIIALIAAIAIGTGYYLYTNTKAPSASLPYQQQPDTNSSEPEPTKEAPTPTETIPPPVALPPQPTTTQSYVGWKTYIYRAPGGGGFSVKYPPGFAVGQERTKDEAYFTVFPSPNPLNKPEVMQIYYEGTGNVRFVQPTDSDDWSYYDQVVQSFQKLK